MANEFHLPDPRAGAKPGQSGKRTVAAALKYEHGDLPRVVASGYGAVAEKILELAFAAGVKVREDADLAELLAAIDLECPIPIAAFEAVAEILNYLYRTAQIHSAAGEMQNIKGI